MCRKVAELSPGGGTIDIWGDGEQTRSFLFIDECIEATRRLMDSDFEGPVNIGSEEMVTINTLADTAAKVSGKEITKTILMDLLVFVDVIPTIILFEKNLVGTIR